MKKIAIGNDFRIAWSLKQLGEDFNVVDKIFDIDVSCPYGAIIVEDVIAEGNTLSFTVPATQQIYAGIYDIKLRITDENTNSHYTLTQCKAFSLSPCCDFSDDVEVVQLDSNIVYPANGINAKISEILSNADIADLEIAISGVNDTINFSIVTIKSPEPSYGSSYYYESVGDWGEGDYMNEWGEPIGDYIEEEVNNDETGA